MKRQKLITYLLVLLLLFTFPFCTLERDNPLDPGSLSYKPLVKSPSPSNESSVSDATPLLNWEDVAGATGYHLQVSISNTFTSTLIDDSSLTASQYQIVSPLSDFTTYYWRVKVKYSDGVWGDWSTTWSFTIDITLQVPANPSPPSGSSIIDTTPLLDWEDITNAYTYHIQVSTVQDFSVTIVDNDTLPLSHYQISMFLSDNTTYYWRVRIKNQDGIAGDWGATWSFTVDIASPVTPIPQNGATITDTTPLLDWEDVVGATGYHIQVSMDNTFSTTMVDDSTLAGTQYQVVTVLSDKTTYYWRVRIKNADGVWGDWSATWSFTVYCPVAISAGADHTVALKSDGTVWAWGSNSEGQLGDGTTTNQLIPTQLSSLSEVTAVSAGLAHTVALKINGTVWAWGRNESGQLGDGTKIGRLTPVQVSGLSGVIAISADSNHTVALKSDGTVWAWGDNSNGQLGDGTTISRLTPVQVSGLNGVIAISAGGWNHTVALKIDGTVWAWGDNYFGQLGDGTTIGRLTPVQVSGLSGVIAISAGMQHTVAIKSDGTVWAWGYNGAGQLGDGTTIERRMPVQVSW
jgi:hypothetical protein